MTNNVLRSVEMLHYGGFTAQSSSKMNWKHCVPVTPPGDGVLLRRSKKGPAGEAKKLNPVNISFKPADIYKIFFHPLLSPPPPQKPHKIRNNTDSLL